MKYLVFMWEVLEASGGMRDFIGEVDKKEEICNLLLENIDEDDIERGSIKEVVQVYSVEDKRVIKEIILDYTNYMCKEEYEKEVYEATIQSILRKYKDYDRESAELLYENKKKKGTLISECVERSVEKEGDLKQVIDKMKKSIIEELKI